MNIEPYQIWNAQFPFGGCYDRRPWLVIDVRNGCWGCFPIASQDYDDKCYFIDFDSQDFQSTGLNKSCYIHDRLSQLELKHFMKYRGMLTGDLLAKFLTDSGL